MNPSSLLQEHGNKSDPFTLYAGISPNFHSGRSGLSILSLKNSLEEVDLEHNTYQGKTKLLYCHILYKSDLNSKVSVMIMLCYL